MKSHFPGNAKNNLMMVKTMAILGNPGKFPSDILEVLMQQNLRLLFISENETTNLGFRERYKANDGLAEIEFSSCEREGCWEADIIAIAGKENISTPLVQRIKEVATQKTVLVISEEERESEQLHLQELLPYSKIIEIELDTSVREFKILGKDAGAISGLISILEQSGYQIKI